MKTNTNLQTPYIVPASVGREARLDQVADSLEEQSLQVRSLNSQELAEYRSYGSNAIDDIDAVQGSGKTCCEESVSPDDHGAQLQGVLKELWTALQHTTNPTAAMAIMNAIIMVLQQAIRLEQQRMLAESENASNEGPDVPPVDGPDETAPPDDHSVEEARGKQTMTPVRAARILEKYFDLIDTAAGKGKKDNLVEIADLEAVAQNPDAPKELREAAAYVLRNPMIRNALDVGNKTGEVDGRFGIKDFQNFIKEHQGKEGYDTPAPGDTDNSQKTGEKAPVKPAPADENSPVDDTPGEETVPSPEAPDQEAPPVKETPQPENADNESAARLSARQDATALHEAMKGAGTNEKALIDVIANRNNRQIQLIKESYQALFQEDLAQRVSSECSSEFRDVLLALLQGTKDESAKIDPKRVRTDADALHQAIAGFGTDDKKLIEILSSRSREHLHEVAKSYQQSYGESLADAISGDTSGDYRTTLLALIA